MEYYLETQQIDISQLNINNDAILVLVSFIIFKIYQKTRVPEGLKNVPTLSFLVLLTEIYNKVGPDKRWEDIRDILEKEGIGKLWFNGEWTLTVTDLGLVKDIITKTDLYPKSLLGESFPGNLVTQYYGDNVVFSNGDVWKRHRRIANPSFRNIPVHVFVESAIKLLNVMEKVDNEPIEIRNLMHGLTLDVLGKAAFGFDFNNLEDPKNVYVTAYNDVMEELSKPIYYLISFLEHIVPRTEAIRKIAKLNSLYDEMVEKKMKSMKTGEIDEKINNNSADLLEHMVHACNDPENPTLTSEELRHDLAIFMLAGHDTTANALSTILYLLAIHKDVQKKVRDEILRVLGDDLTPNSEQQKELKYMNMVINENLRLYPPVANLPRRTPSKDIKFRNHVIPAKTPIIINIYGIHHSSKNWENPEKFIPERFENEKHDHYAWLSFGGGNRLCLGINFSLIEQRIMLCSLLRKYEVSLPADSIHKDKLQIAPEGSGTMGPHPLPLIFKRRTE
ncbi:cytochrome P450 [Glomus cerebriforme]|uniref:Cytochrome P450 n=1 Tax=Glomus cerebriforme TaxID=658196 RepID=A0A397TBL7_9GLOM|nr:cytochrome P450 [Glomus cerebriforme]